MSKIKDFLSIFKDAVLIALFLLLITVIWLARPTVGAATTGGGAH